MNRGESWLPLPHSAYKVLKMTRSATTSVGGDTSHQKMRGIYLERESNRIILTTLSEEGTFIRTFLYDFEAEQLIDALKQHLLKIYEEKKAGYEDSQQRAKTEKEKQQYQELISIWAVRAAYIVNLEVMNKAIENAGPEEFDEQAKQLARIWLGEMRK